MHQRRCIAVKAPGSRTGLMAYHIRARAFLSPPRVVEVTQEDGGYKVVGPDDPAGVYGFAPRRRASWRGSFGGDLRHDPLALTTKRCPTRDQPEKPTDITMLPRCQRIVPPVLGATAGYDPGRFWDAGPQSPLSGFGSACRRQALSASLRILPDTVEQRGRSVADSRAWPADSGLVDACRRRSGGYGLRHRDELGQLPEVLRGSGEEKLVMCAAGTPSAGAPALIPIGTYLERFQIVTGGRLNCRWLQVPDSNLPASVRWHSQKSNGAARRFQRLSRRASHLAAPVELLSHCGSDGWQFLPMPASASRTRFALVQDAPDLPEGRP